MDLKKTISTECGFGWRNFNYQYSHYLDADNIDGLIFDPQSYGIWDTGFIVFEKQS